MRRIIFILILLCASPCHAAVTMSFAWDWDDTITELVTVNATPALSGLRIVTHDGKKLLYSVATTAVDSWSCYYSLAPHTILVAQELGIQAGKRTITETFPLIPSSGDELRVYLTGLAENYDVNYAFLGLVYQGSTYNFKNSGEYGYPAGWFGASPIFSFYPRITIDSGPATTIGGGPTINIW